MNAIKIALARVNRTHETIVVFITTGKTGVVSHNADLCVWRFNRATVRAAHVAGFPVLEREEIEISSHSNMVYVINRLYSCLLCHSRQIMLATTTELCFQTLFPGGLRHQIFDEELQNIEGGFTGSC